MGCAIGLVFIQMARGKTPPDMPTTFAPRLDILTESQGYSGRNWMPFHPTLYFMAELGLPDNLAIGRRNTLTSSLRGVSTQIGCKRGCPSSEIRTRGSDLWVHRKRDNLEAFIDRSGPVKVAFFGGLDTLRRVQDPRRAVDSRVRVASLLDLAGMKMRVIQMRGSRRTMWTFMRWCPTESTCHGFGSGQGD